MHAVRRRLRLYAWLALLSITCLAISPSVSRLLMPPVDVQRANATQWTDATPERHHHDGMMQSGMLPASPHPASHRHSLEHCDFCVLAAHAVAVASVPAGLLDASAWGCQAFLRPDPDAPTVRCDWSPSNPRGPPLA